MPMSQVKGALRETAERLAKIGRAGWNRSRVGRVFGERADKAGLSAPGAVAFLGEAVIAESDRTGIAEDAAHERRGMLYRRIASTAIDEQGTARDRTLRYVEAAVPVTLKGQLEWIAKDPPDLDWVALLDAAAAATVAFGKLKSDGYGAALASVASEEEPLSGPPPAISRALREARRVRLRLTQTRPAIFSARAATEGRAQDRRRADRRNTAWLGGRGELRGFRRSPRSFSWRRAFRQLCAARTRWRGLHPHAKIVHGCRSTALLAE